MALKTHPETVELGTLIRLRRELAGWSQAGLAERAQVSRPTIGKLEIGKAAFPKDSLAKIARALSLTIAEVAQATGRSADELRSAPIYMSDPELGTAVRLRCYATAVIHPTWNDAAYWADIRTLVEAA